MINQTGGNDKKYFYDDIKGKNVVFNSKKFFEKKIMSDKEMVIQMTYMKNKVNHKQESEAFNLINFSNWD